jgi:hypothetical protein
LLLGFTRLRSCGVLIAVSWTLEGQRKRGARWPMVSALSPLSICLSRAAAASGRFSIRVKGPEAQPAVGWLAYFNEEIARHGTLVPHCNRIGDGEDRQSNAVARVDDPQRGYRGPERVTDQTWPLIGRSMALGVLVWAVPWTLWLAGFVPWVGCALNVVISVE